MISCLICKVPNRIWCDFLNSFTKYKVYIVIDDNEFDASDFKAKYKNISFVQIQEKDLVNYKNATNLGKNQTITSWDKALFYFSKLENFIWFFEDDVFFHDEKTLLNIDKQYLDSDLLSNKLEENKDGSKDRSKWENWDKVNVNYNPPWHHGMMCIVRMSARLLRCIDEYAQKNKTLSFLEAMFPTVGMKNNLKCDSPSEFSEIKWRYNFTKDQINQKNLYHPIKNIENHKSLRQT